MASDALNAFNRYLTSLCFLSDCLSALGHVDQAKGVMQELESIEHVDSSQDAYLIT